jgi:hypothetical protein
VSGFAPLVWKIEVDTSGLRKANEAASSMGENMKKTLGVKGVAMGTALGNGISRTVGFAMDKVQEVVGDAFREALDFTKLQAQSEAVIKSTGGAANVSAEQMKTLAEGIQKVSGAQITAAQALDGSNILATFTNIKNAAGQNNDMFNQTTKAAADLSLAMHQDMKSSAVQLGKALNDPVRGMTALQRVGVTFTQAQKDHVAGFMKSNNVIGAQKVILAEVNKEFGGTAAAMGNTPAGKFGAAMAGIKDQLRDIAIKMLPGLTKIAQIFADKVAPAIAAATPTILTIFNFLAKNIKVISFLAGLILSVVGAFKIWTAVMTAFDIVAEANPIGLIVIAIAALIAGIVWVATKTHIFQDMWKGAMKIASDATKSFVSFFTGMGKNINDFFASLTNFLGGIGKNLYNFAHDAWSMYVNGALDALLALPNLVGNILSKIPGLDGIGKGILAGTSNIKTTVSSALGAGPANNGGTVVNNYNVKAQGLTVDQVAKDSKRRGNLMAPVKGGK